MASRGKILCEFSVYSAGVFFMFTGSSALEALQSSINVVGHAGSNSLVASYVASILFGLLFAPSIIERIGVKTALVVGEVGYTAFVVANFFTNEYVLMLGGVIRGLGNSILWPSIAVLNGMYAREYSRQSNSPGDRHLIFFSSMFFIVVHLNQVLGNGISYFILNYQANMTEISFKSNASSLPENLPMFVIENANQSEKCGSRDCQNNYDIENNLTNYLPISNFIRLVLMIAFISVKLFGISINTFISPRIFCTRKTHDFGGYQEIGGSEEEEDEEQNKSIVGTAKNILHHAVDPLNLALTPLTIYTGMLIAFVFNDLTRAYVSCVDGVAKVGIYMSIFGIASAISSLTFGQFVKSQKASSIWLGIAFIVDIGNIASCLLWTRNFGHYMVYINFVLFGITLGLWQPVLLATELKYFKKKSELASTFWNSFTLLGMMINRCAPICVWKKLYSMIAVLVVGIIVYAIGIKCYRRQENEEERRSLLVQAE